MSVENLRRCGRIADMRYYLPGRTTGYCCSEHIHGVIKNMERIGGKLLFYSYEGNDKPCLVLVREKGTDNDSK